MDFQTNNQITIKNTIALSAFIILFAISIALFGIFAFADNSASPPDNQSETSAIEETLFYTKFDANGGTWADGETAKTIAQQTKFYVLPEDPSLTHYGFLGWFTDPVAGDKVTSSTMTENVHTELFAHWEKWATMNIVGGSGHWNYLITYVDEDYVQHQKALYSLSLDLPLSTSYRVQKNDNKLFILNMSVKPIIMYYIEVFGGAAFDLDYWTVNGEIMVPDKIYKIDQVDESITIKANYDFSKDAIPMTMDSDEGISEFCWGTYFNGEAVTTGSLFPYIDVWPVGTKFSIREDGYMDAWFDKESNDNVVNRFSGYIYPVFKEGYKLKNVSLDDGTIFEFNKVYEFGKDTDSFDFIYNAELIKYPASSVTEAAQTGDNNFLLIFALSVIFAISSIPVLRRKESH